MKCGTISTCIAAFKQSFINRKQHKHRNSLFTQLTGGASLSCPATSRALARNVIGSFPQIPDNLHFAVDGTAASTELTNVRSVVFEVSAAADSPPLVLVAVWYSTEQLLRDR